jgi:hypothetical protein
MKKLFAKTLIINKLTDADIDVMYKLFEKYYENTDKVKFISDLKDKTSVILLKCKNKKNIIGFSTIKELEIYVGGKKIRSIFSGDTIIDSGYRGQASFAIEFFKNIITHKLKSPFTPHYWFLISKGYKTYLILTKNYCHYYPRFDQETPKDEEKVLDALGESLFGSDYNPDTKILKHSGKTDSLKSAVAPIDAKSLQNPNIHFFASRNPGWASGDELCCIGKSDLSLISTFISRTALKLLKTRKKSK